MVIGERLKALREHRNMSQGDIEKRTGLLRIYVSRVENGHTVPAIETLEKFARALEIPIYQLFYDGENPPAPAQRKEQLLSRHRTLRRRPERRPRYSSMVHSRSERRAGGLLHPYQNQ